MGSAIAEAAKRRARAAERTPGFSRGHLAAFLPGRLYGSPVRHQGDCGGRFLRLWPRCDIDRAIIFFPPAVLPRPAPRRPRPDRRESVERPAAAAHQVHTAWEFPSEC